MCLKDQTKMVPLGTFHARATPTPPDDQRQFDVYRSTIAGVHFLPASDGQPRLMARKRLNRGRDLPREAVHRTAQRGSTRFARPALLSEIGVVGVQKLSRSVEHLPMGDKFGLGAAVVLEAVDVDTHLIIDPGSPCPRIKRDRMRAQQLR